MSRADTCGKDGEVLGIFGEESRAASPERVFYEYQQTSESAGWFVQIRGGREVGPFQSKECSLSFLDDYSKYCQKINDQGGRKPTLSVVSE